MKTTTLTGVNLGGWFVLEKWMTPSLFAETTARNEFELSKTPQGRRRIRRHHKTFITETDLRWLRDNGIQIVRVPVGHWTLGSDARYVEATKRLDWLVETSLSLGLLVLLDLHAAPGAQNRAEHSGSGNTISGKHSTKWLNDMSAQEQTIERLVELTARYAEYPNIWGVELLNEPYVDRFGLKLARFYRRAYTAVIKVARPGMRIVFSDGYAPILVTNCLRLVQKRDFPAVLDAHIYQVFGRRDKAKTFAQHLRQVRRTRHFLRFLRLQQPVIVGEWSAMLPGKGSPERTHRYLQAQQQAFSVAQAHFYWNYKTESSGRWNYRDVARKN